MKFRVSNKYKNAGGVYIIHSNITNDVYIGKTKCFHSRFLVHYHALKHNRHPQSTLMADYAKKYGFETLSFRVYRVVDNQSAAYYLEQKLIHKLKPSMNSVFDYSKIAKPNYAANVKIEVK